MKLLFLILSMSLYGNAFGAAIWIVDGPSSPCPDKAITYTIVVSGNASPGYTEFLINVIWEISQNDVVIYSKAVKISGSGNGLFSMDHQIPGLPSGQTKIKAILEYYPITFGVYGPKRSTSNTKNIYVGIATPEKISGSNVCPGSSGVFSIDPVKNATSYTWEVPMGWKVNGILGPVVPNQGTSVTITPCSNNKNVGPSCSLQAFQSFDIKVKGVSPTCGQGEYAVQRITIDHPFTIAEANGSDGRAILNVNPKNFPSYSWSLNSGWTDVYGINSNTVSFKSNSVSGLATLTTRTPCNNTYVRTYYYIPQHTLPEEPEPCELEIPTSYLIPENSNLILPEDPCGEVLQSATLYDFGSQKSVALIKRTRGYEFDISTLKKGIYVLYLETTSGKSKTLKFVKKD